MHRAEAGFKHDFRGFQLPRMRFLRLLGIGSADKVTAMFAKDKANFTFSLLSRKHSANNPTYLSNGATSRVGQQILSQGTCN